MLRGNSLLSSSSNASYEQQLWQLPKEVWTIKRSLCWVQKFKRESKCCPVADPIVRGYLLMRFHYSLSILLALTLFVHHRHNKVAIALDTDALLPGHNAASPPGHTPAGLSECWLQ